MTTETKSKVYGYQVEYPVIGDFASDVIRVSTAGEGPWDGDVASFPGTDSLGAFEWLKGHGCDGDEAALKIDEATRGRRGILWLIEHAPEAPGHVTRAFAATVQWAAKS